jgi:hypothetical protein
LHIITAISLVINSYLTISYQPLLNYDGNKEVSGFSTVETDIYAGVVQDM